MFTNLLWWQRFILLIVLGVAPSIFAAVVLLWTGNTRQWAWIFNVVVIAYLFFWIEALGPFRSQPTAWPPTGLNRHDRLVMAVTLGLVSFCYGLAARPEFQHTDFASCIQLIGIGIQFLVPRRFGSPTLRSAHRLPLASTGPSAIEPQSPRA